MNVIYPVILSGGSGTRLWPLSRAMYPKQFIRSSTTAARASWPPHCSGCRGRPASPRPIVVCNNDHRFLVKDEAERAGVTPRAIVLEPVARNTAPAVAVAALSIAQATTRRASWW